MAINPNNGVLDIVNGVLKVSSIDIKESGGFATAINTVARNDVLLYDDQHTNTTFLPAEGTDYRSTTGVTRDTSSIDFNDGWVYWPLKLPNSWHAQFDMRITATGGVFTFSLFNTSTPNHTDYTANDGGYKIVFDNTNNQIDVYWEGSVHATASANVRSTDWQHVNINYFRGAVSVSLAGKVVLNHGFTENYQEADSRYIGFSATSGTSHEIRNLAIHNSDKWFYTHTSNASDIAYVSGNVGIGSLTPTELLDVHGNVHIAQNLTVDGNLTVTGTTFSVDQTNLSIEDPIIELAKGNASDTIDSGLVITRATSNVAVAYRGDESELALGYTQSGASETDVVPVADGGLDVRVYGNLFANNLTTTANVNATYVKGDGSELTQITLDQVVGYGNVTSNTIVSTGNIHANYFHGDGSELNNISATLQEITDNSNVTSNTVQFTNSTTALVADSNVGIGTRTPSANLHVVGYQYVNDPPTQSASFDHSDAPLTLTHSTPTSTTAIDDPKAVLHLTRDGTSGESYGAKASFKMSRYENSGTASRSRLDVTLADGTYADTHVMSLRGDGRMGVGTTNPGYGLDVHGTANVGALTVTSIAGNGSALSDIQSSNVSDFASNVTRIGNLDTNLSSNSLRITNLESSDMSISGKKTFTGDAIFESNIRVKGDLLVANTVNMVVSDPILELGSNNLNTGDLGIVMTRHGASDSNVAIIFDESGDTLNIGYTSGSAYDTTIDIDDTKDLNVKIYGNLHVSNTLTINTVAVSITSGLDEVLNVSNSTTNTIQITNASDTALDVVGGASIGSNLEVGTANLFVDTTTGRVGIGVTNPTYELHMDGNMRIDNGGSISLYRSDTTGGPSLQFRNPDDSTSGWFGFGSSSKNEFRMVTNNNYPLTFWTSATGSGVERMRIAPDGNVGIGTDNPDSKLNIFLNSETGTSNTVGLTITNASSDYTSVTNGFGSRILFKTNRGGTSATNIQKSAEIKGYVYAGAGGTQDYHALDLDVYGDNSSLNKGISIQSMSSTGGPADTIVHGTITASGSTSGSAHSSSCILYLLDTPQINEWSWTGATNNTLRITYSNLPAGCKAVLADVFMPQHSNDDHVGHMLGRNVTQRTIWTGGRNIQPSTQFGNLAQQVIYFNMPGQNDNFEYYFGNWWPSQIIPLDTNNRMYHTVTGESSGTSSWMYIVTKGYYL